MSIGNYSSETWIRDEIDGRAEERPLRLEDAVAYLANQDIGIKSGKVKFTKDAISDAWMGKSSWLKLSGYNNDRYQEALDKYLMRRNVWTVSAHRECLSSSYSDTEIVSGAGDSSITMKFAGGNKTYDIGNDDPSKWRIQSFHAEDKHTGDQSVVRITIITYTEWKLTVVAD